ncbi:hypothetical protein CLBKND_00442 [Methylorubrum aminovorans]
MGSVSAGNEQSAAARAHAPRPLIGLDLLRFGAACLVMLDHLPPVACLAGVS